MDALRRALMPAVLAAEIELEGLEVLTMPMSRGRRLTRECQRERAQDRSGDVVLHGEHVADLAIIFGRPQLVAVVDTRQPYSNPQTVTDPQDTTFQDAIDVERLADLLQVVRSITKVKRRYPRGHAQPR